MTVQEWLETKALAVRAFYPTAVAKATGLSLETVFDELVGFAYKGWLDLGWEARCPECFRALCYFAGKNDGAGETITCNICGEKIEITPDIVFPVFFVTVKYREKYRGNNIANQTKRD